MGYYRGGLTVRALIERLGQEEGLYFGTDPYHPALNGFQVQRVLGGLGKYMRRHPDHILRVVDAILSTAGQDECPTGKPQKRQRAA
jgi:hypothetical protein